LIPLFEEKHPLPFLVDDRTPFFFFLFPLFSHLAQRTQLLRQHPSLNQLVVFDSPPPFPLFLVGEKWPLAPPFSQGEEPLPWRQVNLDSSVPLFLAVDLAVPRGCFLSRRTCLSLIFFFSSFDVCKEFFFFFLSPLDWCRRDPFFFFALCVALTAPFSPPFLWRDGPRTLLCGVSPFFLFFFLNRAGLSFLSFFGTMGVAGVLLIRGD